MRIDLEKAEAALLLLIAAALAARLALLLAALAAVLAGSLTALAVAAGNATGLGHLYLLRRFFIRLSGQKLMNAAPGTGSVR